MSEWQKARIADVCTIEKGTTGLASATPGKYPMVTTGADRKTCADYQFDTEAACIPLVSSTGHGKKTLNYVHFQSGKFALGTILAAVIPKDQKQLSARFLHLYLSHFKDSVLVPLMKGAANVSLPMSGIANVEIPLPPIVRQLAIVDLVNRLENEHAELETEGKTQAAILKQLRLAILQEAVEGKLTADYRKRNPLRKGEPEFDAAALLEKIKVEKEKLINVGKIKKEKPLEPTKDGDKPFDLPEAWAWCRLGALGFINPRNYVDDSLDAGFTPMPFVSAKYGVKPIFEIRRWGHIKTGFTHFANDDVAIAKITPCFENSKACVFEGLPNSVGAGTTELHVLRPILANPFYVYIYVKTSSFLSAGAVLMTGAVGQKRVPADYFSNSYFPLPPLAEQRAIVTRINALMSNLDELENQISERQSQTEVLMQSVLREVFEGGHGG
jgi:type I restriction enzyme S subunit